jgi:hypothetical protein
MMILLSNIGNHGGKRSEEHQIAKDEGKRLRHVIADQGVLSSITKGMIVFYGCLCR